MIRKDNIAASILAMAGSMLFQAARWTWWMPVRLCDIPIGVLCHWMALVCSNGTVWISKPR
ncbi:MAG: hypothetical protein JWP63_3901 [Candidatus Solibacter sp.]|nr:hypothetical protein [Candidatus Solibacter sp.]